MVGITENKDGTYAVTLQSDLNQPDPDDLGGAKESGKGTGKHTDTYDPATGKWRGVSASKSPTYFVVECPKVATYHSTVDPGTIPPPRGPWVPVTTTTGETVPDVAIGGHLWIGKLNLYVSTYEKTWTVTIKGTNADRYGVSSIRGYRAGQPPTEAEAATQDIDDDPGPPTKKRKFTFFLKPQPDWEVVDLVRLAGGERSETITVESHSFCRCAYPVGPMLSIWRSWFGVLGVDTYDIIEVSIFPNTQAVDIETAPEFTAPGTWTPSFVYTDPDGEPRPQGGVLWTLEGGVDGLAAGEEFALTMHMLETADSAYSLYALDALSGEYLNFRIVADAYD